ncbi:nicotinate-nucleotide--dimethylbenzimidazole phosphoribosyltransferase [Thermosediminibacter oceani]|uniref:Nicotinate-nucleotide--dimethylbenzimidazole phosphoribosyltransferase n=1 Tax=Thermosediminibacter oceani (strain ATCC BAA-1034 / DSM 16646 / JW/IW-1228P) TaxID=555079 RepID=D9S021_THEOJ|nr:nicotinate-nucleotide--dimethylbenzimidazole phosphoribosyltransferase [Thermosediminibacter oceani]ADL06949.1 nicotinate-nucleotide/dimethylbenzimidazolephosp horibosyltransferase [Thermosediminibacter oceani DSM 16646]
MKLLEEALKNIGDLDEISMKKAKERLDNLTKPRGSLGILEDLAVKMAGIKRELYPKIKNKVITIMAGDHGVVEEGVSAFPQEVTPQMILNFLSGGAGINVLARHAGAKIVCVDVGTAADVFHPDLIIKKVRRGTDNISRGPAMTREEAIKAIEVGIETAWNEIDKGADILGTGDMGIGNTTPSSAILAVYSDEPLEKLVGRGTGINDERLKLKIKAINRALEINQPDPNDPIGVLSKVGGLEIGAIAGCILGAASRRIPVVIDGFISTAGAIIAAKIEPLCTNYMIASHSSEEPGHKTMLKLLGLEPMLSMRMRLGEGTGAALAFNLVEAALKIISEMATFDEAGVSGQLE